MKIRAKNIILFLHILLMLMYLWRSLFETIGFYPISYLISIFLAIANVLSHFFCGRSGITYNKYLNLYIVYGIILFFFSLINKGILISLMGVASLFLNLVAWKYSICLSTDKEDDNKDGMKKYFSTFLFAMVVNIIVGLYQYFIDPSVFGLVSGIFGSKEFMSASNVTRRVVGFMGSPQVFSATCGISLFVASTIENSIWRLMISILIIVGGLLTGSRAFGIFVILFVAYIAIDMNYRKRLICIILVIVALMICGSYVGGIIRNSETLSRNFIFTRWAASKIYFNSFSKFKWYEFVFGKGFGLDGWNASLSNISFDYSSTESCLISIVYQLGTIEALFFVLAFCKIFLNIKQNKLGKFLILGIFINLCCTPAFAGFAFSYIAWPLVLLLNNNFKFKKV